MKRVAVVAALVLVLAMMLMMLTMRVDANMLRHHRHRVVSDDDATSSNVNKPNPIDSDVTTADCHLRHFVLTAVGVIQPDSATTSWVQAAHTALQIDELCPTTEPVKTTLSPPRPVAEPIPISPDSCDISYYVATDGSDSNAGTLASPFATLAHAIASTRSVRALTSLSSPCIFLRAGTYYLGESLPATAGSPKDSQFGAIDLISFDSGLTIAAYQGETVVLSGGARLTPSWQVYAQTATGTIYSTKLTPTNPSTQLLTDSFHLNELFVGGERAVRAKWPNGDPSTHGLFSSDTGYDSSAMNWLPPFPYNASVEVHGSSPSVFDDYFPNYQMGIGGPAHVYDPPRSFWATANPPGGGGATFIVPSGMNATGTDLAARAAKWSNPSTGYAHVFHGGAWANWIFSLGSYDANSSLLHFTEGGFQDARGWSTGGAFYVEWLIEELDDGFEWFFDESSQTLYFMPNGTGTAPPTELIVSQLPCILSAHGSADAPISNIVLSGLTFSHTSNTMMRKFEVPSGGDWSLHRGGAVFLTGTAYSTIQNSIFSYLGGTGVVISDWNLGTEVTTSEFVWGCDSGVVVLGTVSGIDGVTNTNQPTLVRVTNSLFHELGIYIKQSAPVLVSLSRSITVSGNAMFNVPRAGINVNDPFYGNHTLMGNVIFNTVRETADHGPINTWDRLPLMTLQLNETTGEWVPTIDPHVSYITRNLLFNAYHSAWPIDHDDGSRRYDDSRNVLVYGGFKNFLGNSKRVHNMVYIYPDFPRLTTTSSSSWLSSVHAQRITRTSPPELAQLRAPLGWGGQCVQAYSPLQNVAGWNEHWYENTCALWATSQPYELDSCQIGNLYNMIPFLANNTLYFPEGVTAQIPCALANGTAVMLTLADMQALGYDLGTTQSTVPPTTALVQLALETLFAV